MDRRIALLALCALALFACEGNPYDPEGLCRTAPTSAWKENELVVSGSANVWGSASVWASAHVTGDGGATKDGLVFYVRRDDGFRYFRLTFHPPAEVGVHRLEDVGGVALVCPAGTYDGAFAGACVDSRGDPAAPDRFPLNGTLEVLDMRLQDSNISPEDPPEELPWGWRMTTTNAAIVVDLRVESRLSRFDPGRDCSHEEEL